MVEAESDAETWLEIDGEPLGRLPARFECLPGALRLTVGSEEANRLLVSALADFLGATGAADGT